MDVLLWVVAGFGLLVLLPLLQHIFFWLSWHTEWPVWGFWLAFILVIGAIFFLSGCDNSHKPQILKYPMQVVCHKGHEWWFKDYGAKLVAPRRSADGQLIACILPIQGELIMGEVNDDN